MLENDPYVLPSSNEDMKTFINKFKVDMMEHIVSSIKFAVENNLPIVEVFQFKNSQFVITISEKEFESNLENINKFYLENKMKELCDKVDNLIKSIKRKNDEKAKSAPKRKKRNNPDK